MRAFFLTLVVGSGSLGACRSRAPAPEPAFVDEIRLLNSELERRFRTGDLLGVADLYADDAVLMGPGGFRIEGREAIDAYWSRISDPLDWRLEIFEIGGSNETAYELGRSHLTVNPDGAPETSVVDFLVLWKREEGALRVGLDLYWEAQAPQR